MSERIIETVWVETSFGNIILSAAPETKVRRCFKCDKRSTASVRLFIPSGNGYARYKWLHVQCAIDIITPGLFVLRKAFMGQRWVRAMPNLVDAQPGSFVVKMLGKEKHESEHK